MAPRSEPFPAAELLGRRVRQRRLELGRTQEAVAEAAGLHPKYMTFIERGGRNLGLLTILRVAHALDVDPGDLMRGLRP